MRIACAVFVKTPGLSPIKTRLAARTGEALALEFYERSCRAIAELLETATKQAPQLLPHWAVAERAALDSPFWRDFPRVAQVGDGLGPRLDGVYSQLQSRFGAALLLGADSPLLSPDDILAGIRALESHPFALGRAKDGGFFLFAGREAVPSQVWLETPYSVSSTADELHQRIARLGGIAELPHRGDIDTWEDLVAEFSVPRNPAWLPVQRNLWEWVRSKLIDPPFAP